MLRDEAKKLGNLVETTGACKFCGQMATVEAPEGWEGEMITCLATEACSCKEARDWTKKREQAKRMTDSIEDLFEDYETKEFMAAAVRMISEDMFAGVTVDFGDGMKASAKITRKGAIVIKKTKVTQESREA